MGALFSPPTPPPNKVGRHDFLETPKMIESPAPEASKEVDTAPMGDGIRKRRKAGSQQSVTLLGD
jgi:hypothetical protein